MRNQDVIDSFLNRHACRGLNLRTDGQTLISYSTPIAKWSDDGELMINSRKYSPSTSRIQSKLLATAINDGHEYTFFEGRDR